MWSMEQEEGSQSADTSEKEVSSEKPNERQEDDSRFKEVIQQQVEEILPCLAGGVIYCGTLNIEQVRPTMRSDRVYLASAVALSPHAKKILDAHQIHKGKKHIKALLKQLKKVGV